MSASRASTVLPNEAGLQQGPRGDDQADPAAPQNWASHRPPERYDHAR